MAIKLFFFDMDGTLFAQQTNVWTATPGNSVWNRIVNALPPEARAQDEAMFQRFHRGEYRSYLDWCKDTAEMYKTFGLTRDTFKRIISEGQYNEGVREVFEELHKRGIITAIISGGFMAQASRAQQDFKITHALAAIKLYWNKHGTLDHFNTLPADNLGKVDFVELLRREYKLDKSECAFIGDGLNDVEIAKHVGLSFAFNGHPELQKVATHSITDFREILDNLP